MCPNNRNSLNNKGSKMAALRQIAFYGKGGYRQVHDLPKYTRRACRPGAKDPYCRLRSESGLHAPHPERKGTGHRTASCGNRRFGRRPRARGRAQSGLQRHQVRGVRWPRAGRRLRRTRRYHLDQLPGRERRLQRCRLRLIRRARGRSMRRLCDAYSRKQGSGNLHRHVR